MRSAGDKTRLALPSICILAGGRGTRLGGLTDDAPKPLIEVAGRPFIEHILEGLSDAGARHVVLSIGYLAAQFSEVLGDGSRFGLKLDFVEDGNLPAGTAGGVRNCLPLLDDSFIVMYGDSLLRVNPDELVNAHRCGKRPGTMTVMRSALGYESANCVVTGDAISAYSKNPPPPEADYIDYGMLMFEKQAFEEFDGSDLADLQSALARSGRLTAFVAETPYTEIGTPDALVAAEELLRKDNDSTKGKVHDPRA